MFIARAKTCGADLRNEALSRFSIESARNGHSRVLALPSGESQNQIDTQLAVRVLIDACVDVSDLSGFVMSLFVFTAQTSAASYGVSPVMWTGFSSAQNPTSLASSGRQDLSCH